MKKNLIKTQLLPQPAIHKTTPHARGYQQGMTVLGMLLLGALMVFWVLSIIKLTPVYIEDHNIKSIFKDYEEQAKEVGTSKAKIQAYFSRFLQVNNVRSIDERAIKVESKEINDKPKVIVSLENNVEVPMVGNLFFLVKGRYSATVDKQDDSSQ